MLERYQLVWNNYFSIIFYDLWLFKRIIERYVIFPKKIIALVEFETSQAAKFAVSIMRKREKTLQFR